VWQYGVSGSSGSNDGIGLMHALNGTQLLEWPMLVPAGAALLPRVWVNGSRVMFGTDVPDFGSFNPGDRLFYKGAACVAGGAEGKVCVTAGTQGTYAGGRTATADGSAVIVISGATMGTLYDQHHFKVGDWVTVDGSPRHQVIAVSANGLTVTLDGSVTAGGPGLAMAFSPPTFKEFGSIAA
jgi:hypothetical protein